MKVDFFIVGAPKAGTTSLYHYLNEHPKVEMSSQKEPNYFSDKHLQEQGIYYEKNRINTLEKYHSLFIQKENKLFGEASVSYLFYEDVPKKIKKYNPNAKIIIMLRNPADRAFSHYLMDYRLGLISDSFEVIINRTSKAKHAHIFYQQYIKVSKYYHQLSRYFNVFDNESILIIDYDDFKNDISNTLTNIYGFLNISNKFPVNINEKHNTFSMPRHNFIRRIYSFFVLRNTLNYLIPKTLKKGIRKILFMNDRKPELSTVSRKKLNELFEKDIENLELLLNKDLTKWLK